MRFWRLLVLLTVLLSMGSCGDEKKLVLTFDIVLDSGIPADTFLQGEKLILTVYKFFNEKSQNLWLTLRIDMNGARNLCNADESVCYQFEGRDNHFSLITKVDDKLRYSKVKFTLAVQKGEKDILVGGDTKYNYYQDYSAPVVLPLHKAP